MELRLDVDHVTVDRAPAADSAACGVALDDRPLRGPAGRADWRMCGRISRHLLEGRFDGRRGENLLMGTSGRLVFPRLFLFGLGRLGDLDESGARRAASSAATVLLRAGAESVLVPLWDLTRDRVPFEDALDSFLIGCARAVARGLRTDSVTITFLARNAAESGRISHHIDHMVKEPGPGGLVLVRFMFDSMAGQRYV